CVYVAKIHCLRIGGSGAYGHALRPDRYRCALRHRTGVPEWRAAFELFRSDYGRCHPDQRKWSGKSEGVGVSVVIQSNTIVRSQTGGLSPDRGSVSVATGNGFSVFARDFKIVPTSSAWTEFYISRASGVIQIIARKNGISISCGPTTSTIKEGQQIRRD